MLLGVTQHWAGCENKRITPGALFASRHAQAGRRVHLATFLKRVSYHNFLMSQAHRGCRRLSLVGSHRWRIAGPQSGWNYHSRGSSHNLSFCVSAQSRWSLTTYCESGSQNDHIIFLIHVVSPPLPSRPLFALRNEGYWRKECQWVHKNRGVWLPFSARVL